MIDIDYSAMEQYYMNDAQIKANLIDANTLIAELARATGKTEGVMGPRTVKVANSMPGELGFLVHKTYAALMTNVWPNIQAYYSRPINGGRRSMLEYGIDYIVGEGKIPSHFQRPRYPIAYPKHSVLFRNGFHLQMVSSDQPESVAGRSAVHAFIEEMKHQKGVKIKSRLFPALRGSAAKIRKSEYYQGITGVSDTARVDLGEDAWFEEFEANQDKNRIDEIAAVAMHVNKALYKIYESSAIARAEKNPILAEKLRLEIEKQQRVLTRWQPRLSAMRQNCTYYLRGSSFINKEILGPKFFKTQYDSLSEDEFLSSICGVRHKAVVDRFFANYHPRKHQFSDSYKYESILRMDLKDHFTLTASYLKHYNPKDELLLGYDPGSFSSLVVAQEKKDGKELKVLKEFTVYSPAQQPEMASQFKEFFGDPENKKIKLYYDRAANKRREEFDRITTDAQILKRELESHGYSVELMNEGQATIYYWQQYKLLLMIFNDFTKSMPDVALCENECKNLCSSIMLSPRKMTDGKIELDKSSEKKVALPYQAGLTTQLPSALIYLLYGRYSERMPSEYSNIPDNLLDNISM